MERKLLLKESIHRALAQGLITDETLAYIRALSYARRYNPADQNIAEAIAETLSSIQAIYELLTPPLFSDEDRRHNAQRVREKLGEGLAGNFNDAETITRLAVTVPNRIINYLEQQSLLLLPLEIKVSTFAEVGKYRSFPCRFKGKVGSRKMYDLHKHWIGLYFRADLQKVAEGEQGMREFPNPAVPVKVNTTTFNFVDTNLRNTSIDLFYPGLAHQLNDERIKGISSILCFNLAFKNCWVKNMNLQFWHYVSNFPGTIAISFENCDDFDEAYFPYLRQEVDGLRYYFDLEKFAEIVTDLASEEFKTYLESLLRFSAAHALEHLR